MQASAIVFSFEPRDSKSFRVGLHDVGGFMPRVRLESGIPFENIRKNRFGRTLETRTQRLFWARLGAQSYVLGPRLGQYIPPSLTACCHLFCVSAAPFWFRAPRPIHRRSPRCRRHFFSSGRAIRDDERSWYVAARVLTRAASRRLTCARTSEAG